MVASIHQLSRLVNALLAQEMSNAPTPQAAPAPNGLSFLTDPKFLAALSTTTAPGSAPSVPVGRQSSTALPAKTQALQRSVSNIGYQPHHQSIFGKVFDLMSRPMFAVGEAARQGLESDVQGKGIGDLLKSVGSGAIQGFEGKQKTDWTRILDEAGQLHHEGLQGKTIQQAVRDVNAGKAIKSDIGGKTAALGGLIGDIAFDPLTYVGIGAATKVKDVGHTAEEFAKAKDVQKTLQEAGHSDTNAIPKLLLGDLKEGKYYRKGALPNSAQRAETMQRVAGIAEKYGDASWEKFIKGITSDAEKQVAEQGFKKFDTVKELRSAFKGSPTLKATKGNISKENLNSYNTFVERLISKQTRELQGTATKIEHKREAAAHVLDLASKGNLAGKDAAAQMERRLAVRFAGKDVAHLKVPDRVSEISKAIAGSKAAAPARDFVDAMHGHVNTIFRTGSHVDPVVNAIRMATHSSIVDKVNNHVQNLKSIWGRVSKGDRERVATAVTQGLKNVPVAGGKDLVHGTQVNDLVAHTNSELEHLQRLVGEHEGALVTHEELNSQLPEQFKIHKQYQNDPNWLREAWRGQYLDEKAPYLLQRTGKDPATFLHTMQKAILTASAKKERDATIISRFGHQLRGTQGYGMKRAKNPAAEMLRDKHGYRSPMIVERPGQKAKPIPGYGNHVFHPDVARGIEAMHTMLEREARHGHISTDRYVNAFKDATQMFKTVVTKFNPGFHERNIIGEVMNSMADGVLSSKPYRKSLQVLRLHGRKAFDTGEDMGKRGARIHNGIDPNAYEKARIAAVDGNDVILHKRFTINTPNGEKYIKGATPDMLWHAYVANGLKTGWITTEFGKVVEGGAVRRTLRGVNTGAQHVTENIEDYARLAHFISRIERSPLRNFERAAEDAAQYVRKYHFDYTDFTHVEKNIISRIIPFYKWTRKNIPLQMALMFQKPGYMLTQMKALSAISEAKGYRPNGSIVPNAGEVMPVWLKDALAVPVGQGSSGTRYLDAPLPTRDAFKFFGEGAGDTTTNMAYMLNPFIKDPLELKTGHQVGGAPIAKSRYFAGMTPFTNLLHNMMNSSNTGKSTNILQFLSGLGLMENTPARINSELKREQSAGSAARKKYRTSHGMLPVGGRP